MLFGELATLSVDARAKLDSITANLKSSLNRGTATFLETCALLYAGYELLEHGHKPEEWREKDLEEFSRNRRSKATFRCTVVLKNTWRNVRPRAKA